jgi:ribonuclease D
LAAVRAAAEIIELAQGGRGPHPRRRNSPVLPERYRGPSPKGAVGDLIRVLLKSVAEQHGVAARIIATSDDIDALVLDDEADVPALKGWRRKLFGDKALDDQARPDWPRCDAKRRRSNSPIREPEAAE